ncbi:Phenylalanyl-tRNA synthetase subunit beta [Anopheles sinensis]|uniref:Phenylalanyl-tRNA synthetase subunit beta n=1 Tax=Anopheles sinensis TaxID=74873 RepID=A0A084VK28_ANOSI|nr:Phenylalanyl-tRNA synthetase subunit beta [Anopheles sinensis]
MLAAVCFCNEATISGHVILYYYVIMALPGEGRDVYVSARRGIRGGGGFIRTTFDNAYLPVTARWRRWPVKEGWCGRDLAAGHWSSDTGTKWKRRNQTNTESDQQQQQQRHFAPWNELASRKVGNIGVRDCVFACLLVGFGFGARDV